MTLREAREKRGLSQIQLGELADMPSQLVGQYENGVRYPNDEHVRRLAEALGEPRLEEIFLTREDVKTLRGKPTLVAAVKRLMKKWGLI